MLGLIAALIALYGLYLLYLGLPVLMRSPPDKAIGYTIVVVLCAIVLNLIIGAVTTLVGGALGFGAAGMAAKSMSRNSSDTDAAANILSNMLGAKTDADKARMKEAVSTMENLGKQAQAAEKAAKASGADPAAAAANSVDVAAALSAASTMMAGGKDVTPVDFRALKDLLPDALPGGLQRTESSGQSGEAAGIKGQQRECPVHGRRQHVHHARGHRHRRAGRYRRTGGKTRSEHGKGNGEQLRAHAPRRWPARSRKIQPANEIR
jgi:hypothetical protein